MVLFDSITSFEKDRLRVENKKKIKKWKEINNKDSLKLAKDIFGSEVLNRVGKYIGSINDICFDEESGLVKEIIVSDGIVEDLFKGKRIMPVIGKVEFSEDCILTDNEAEEEMHNAENGLHIFFKDYINNK